MDFRGAAMDGVFFADFRAEPADGHGLRIERVPRAPGCDGGGAAGGAHVRAGASAAEGRAVGLDRRMPGPRGGAAGAVLGRSEELRLVRGAVRSHGVIEFTAECGGGKTALLHAVGPDVYIRMGGTSGEDFLQVAVREFYVYPAGARRLSSEECRAALGRLAAVIALDDVRCGAEQFAAVRRALPGCAVLVGAERPVIGLPGVSHPLPGLDEPDALTLLVRDLGHFVPDSELPVLRRLVAALDGRPLALRRAAALVRHSGHTVPDLTRRVEEDPDVLEELAVAAIGPGARRVLAVLALIDGAVLPSRLVAAMAGLPRAAEEFEPVVAHGLAERHGDRYGLSAGSEPHPFLHQYVDLGGSMHALGSWLVAHDPRGDTMRDAAQAALALLALAAEEGERRQAVRLATAAGRVLFVQGLWQAYGRVLVLGAEAARRAQDTAAEAYFAHQQGSLHLLEGRGAAARRELAHALDLRAGLGDAAGAAVTRANLALVPPASAAAGPARYAADRRGRILIAAVLTVLLVALGVGIGIGVSGSGGSATVGATASGSMAGAPATSRTTRGGGGADGVGPGSPGAAPSPALPPDSTSAAPGTGAPGATGGAKSALRPPLIKGVADYGSVHAGPGHARVAAFTITNPDDRPLTLSPIVLGSPPGASAAPAVPGPPGSPSVRPDSSTAPGPSGSADFAITADSCRAGGVPVTLAPGARCAVSVRFAPTALGRRDGALSVSSGGSTSTTALTGRGFATVKVTLTPDRGHGLHGYVAITVDGVTTKCARTGGCTVRYFDARSPITLRGYGYGGEPYDPGGWTGPCTGSHSQCVPTLGGDISTSLQFLSQGS